MGKVDVVSVRCLHLSTVKLDWGDVPVLLEEGSTRHSYYTYDCPFCNTKQ